MTRLVFLSYATDRFIEARDALCQSARDVGFSNTFALGPHDLDADFCERNGGVLSEKRGAGYWIWKPEIILQTLKTLDPCDVLVYSDAGRSSYYRLSRRPDALISKAKQNGFLTGVAVHQHGPLSTWTKRDAFIRLGLDTQRVHSAPVIQATWSVWTPTDQAFDFLKAWRSACEDPACLTDQPNIEGKENLPDFKDHRHDQSLSSLVTYQTNAPHLDYRTTSLFKILALRPQSKLAHHFLKRIEDAEAMERREMIPALVRSFVALRR